MNRSLRSDESGAALALVLGFVVFAGLVVGGLLNQVQNNSTTLVARKISFRVSAATAGLEYAIRQARTSGTVCATPVNMPVPVPGAAVVNARPVTVTCKVSAGGPTGAGGWAVFITNGSGQLVASNGNVAKVMEGDVYNGGSGGVSVSGGPLSVIKIVNGKYVQTAAGACPPSGLAFSPSPPLFGGATCGAVALDYLVAAPSPRKPPASIGGLPVNPASTAPTYSTECRIFVPGIYQGSTGLTLLNSLSANNYFRPGVYILDLPGPDPVWHIRRWVTAGRPNTGSNLPDTRQTTSTDCPPAQIGADNDGATFFLARQSRISVEMAGNKKGHFEVFSFLDGDFKTPALAVRKLLLSDLTDAPWVTPYVSTNDLTKPAILSTTTGTGPELALHGNTWVPLSKVEVFVTNVSIASLRGGVVAGSLDLAAANSIGGDALAISSSTGTGFRRAVITSESDKVPLSNEKTLKATAVVDIVNDDKRTANIVSWVVDNK